MRWRQYHAEYHERCSRLRGDFVRDHLVSGQRAAPGPRDHDKYLRYSVLPQSTADGPIGFDVVACLPVDRAGVVNFGKALVDPDTQGSQQGQPGNQHSSTETESRQLAVLDGSGHRAHVDTEDRGGLGDRHDGSSADPQLVEIHGGS